MEYRVAVRRVLGCAVVLLLAFTACNGGDDDTASPTTTAPSTTTTGPADPYAIPDTIDVAYVQRVIDKLYEIDGDAARVIVREGELVPLAAERLAAVYSPAELDIQLRLWNDALRAGLQGFRDPPGNRGVVVQRLMRVSEQCVSFAATDDFGAVVENPPPPSTNFFALEPKTAARDEGGLNPTPWMVAFDRAPDPASGAEPEDPCAE